MLARIEEESVDLLRIMLSDGLRIYVNEQIWLQSFIFRRLFVCTFLYWYSHIFSLKFRP